jgi:hypothetical protein
MCGIHHPFVPPADAIAVPRANATTTATVPTAQPRSLRSFIAGHSSKGRRRSEIRRAFTSLELGTTSDGPEVPLASRSPTTTGVRAAAAVGLSAGCAAKADGGKDTPTAAKRQTPVHGDLPALPVEERWTVVERSIDAAAESADVGGVDAFETAVDDGGPSVEKLTERGSKLELKATPGDAAGRGVVADVGHVAGAYAAFLRDGGSSERVSVTLLDGEKDPFGSFQVVAVWARRYVDGEWTAKEYGEAVLGTLKTKS